MKLKKPENGQTNGVSRVVNVQKAGEVFRCNICGNIVLVSEAGGGEIVCHDEPMQLIEVQENQTG
jgi:desulfoferrodoxin-like iron-binding protein